MALYQQANATATAYRKWHTIAAGVVITHAGASQALLQVAHNLPIKNASPNWISPTNTLFSHVVRSIIQYGSNTAAASSPVGITGLELVSINSTVAMVQGTTSYAAANGSYEAFAVDIHFERFIASVD